MLFSLEDLAFLTSPRGEGLLAHLANADLSNAGALGLITALRREFSPRESSAGLELATLRRKAVEKFGAAAASMFFSGEALEQASHPAARAWREKNWRRNGDTVLDVCCGIGADALAFAQSGATVTGVDIDPIRLEMARLNAVASGLSATTKARFEAGDARQLSRAVLDAADLIFFDPGRRDERGRIHHVEGYEPPLSTIQGWGERRIWVKLSPGVQIDQIAAYLADGAGIDFISAEGDLKEAMLRLHDGETDVRRAVMALDGDFQVIVTEPEVGAPLDKPRRWLVEPDPAIIRAGAVAQIANQVEGALLDEEIAYFTTDALPAAPYLRAWRIRDWMPFHVKRLRAYLREQQVGSVTVKKRGTAVTPDVLIPQLKLSGTGSCTLVLTRLKGQQVVLICDDYARDLST